MQFNEQLLDYEVVKNSKQPLINLFIRRTAVLTSVSESLAEKIIKDQWDMANKMTQPAKRNSEIDIPNIGLFYISANKAKKRLLRLEKNLPNLTDPLFIQRNREQFAAIKFKTKYRED